MARYIDVDKLLESIKESRLPLPQTGTFGDHFFKFVDDNIKDTLEEAIKDQPMVELAEVKHGKWTDAYISGVHHYRCTNCGEYIEAIWTANFDYNFCPNCGAKMDRGGNDGH